MTTTTSRDPTSPVPAAPTGTGSRVTRILGVAIARRGRVSSSCTACASRPADAKLGETIRILYMHVPTVSAAYLAFVITAVGSVMYLWKRSEFWDLLAASSAEIGVLFFALTILNGMLWGKITWGVFWRWEPRLTTTAVLFLIYLGYLAARAIPTSTRTRGTISAVIGIMAVVNIPIVHKAVDWWRGLHQEKTIFGTVDPDMKGTQLFTAYLGLTVFMLIFALAAHPPVPGGVVGRAGRRRRPRRRTGRASGRRRRRRAERQASRRTSPAGSTRLEGATMSDWALHPRSPGSRPSRPTGVYALYVIRRGASCPRSFHRSSAGGCEPSGRPTIRSRPTPRRSATHHARRHAADRARDGAGRVGGPRTRTIFGIVGARRDRRRARARALQRAPRRVDVLLQRRRGGREAGPARRQAVPAAGQRRRRHGPQDHRRRRLHAQATTASTIDGHPPRRSARAVRPKIPVVLEGEFDGDALRTATRS